MSGESFARHMQPFADIDLRRYGLGGLPIDILVTLCPTLHPLRVRALLPALLEPRVQFLHPSASEDAGVIQLRGAPGLARVRVPGKIVGALEREVADLVDPDVVRVTAAIVPVVGDDDLRTLLSDDADQPTRRLVQIGLGK